MSFFSITKNSFLAWIIIFLLAEILSWLAFYFDWLNLFVLLIVALATAILVWKKPIFSLYIPLAEIFWGSLGHSFDYKFLSIRLVIFLVIILIWSIKNISRFPKLKIIQDTRLWPVYLMIIFLVVLGIVTGYYKSFNFYNIFLDANAFGYLLYLPIWYQVYEPKYYKNIFVILKAAALIIAIKTLIIFNIFSQYLHGIDNDFYRWIRDTRTGEITDMGNNFYRVFMQSQFYLLIAWFWLFIKNWQKFIWFRFIYLSFISAALLVSLSRSFWLGGTVALVFLFINILIFSRQKFWLHILRVLAIACSAFLLVQIFYNIPKINNINILQQRATNTNEASVNSRLQLWDPLWQGIKQYPVTGHGFGKQITYYSEDPRIDGLHSTYAFEWGWLDMWLKAGFVFVLSFVYWLWLLYRRAYAIVKHDTQTSLFILSSITSLIIIHFFTPYLNHPLGLALLILLTILLSYGKTTKHYYKSFNLER
jgi:O-antigen ligase